MRRAARARAGVTLLAAAACREVAVDPSGVPDLAGRDLAHRMIEPVSVCHVSGAQPAILEIGRPALAGHVAHGDYVAGLHVDRAAPPTDDGVGFQRIGDALDAARAGRLARGELLTAACRITISISAGTYPGSTAPTSPEHERFPMIVDVPDITLRGALVMQIDANGRAAGATPGPGETVLSPTEPLAGAVSPPLVIANAHPDGSAGHGLTVEGLVFRSGRTGVGTDAGGQGILSVRVRDLTVRGNRFDPGFTESIDLRASEGDVLHNQLAGTAGSCDVCLAGPGRYRAIGNKLDAGGIPGIAVSGMVGLPLPNGVEPLALLPVADTWAEIRNNEVRDHRRLPVGVGLRVEAVGVMAPGVYNRIRAVLQDNLLIDNRFGIIVHGGFPAAGSPNRADVDVTLRGNTIQQSCQAKLLVSLVRHQRTLGLNPSLPYMTESNVRIDLGSDLRWDEAWYGHEAGFGNSLTVDGVSIPNGVRQFYSAAGCPAP